MKKKVFSLLLIPILWLFMALSVCAQENTEKEHPSRVVDEADVLSSDEEAALTVIYDGISERQQLDVAVVVAESSGVQKIEDYAADYYDNNNYGIGDNKDGIMLIITMEEREWFILTTGYGIDAFSDADLDYIADEFLGDLSSGNYMSAFETFAEQCDAYLTYLKDNEGAGNDSGDYAETYAAEEESRLFSILSTLIIAALLAFLPVSLMKGDLKSVRSQRAAGDYIKYGSQKITNQKDIFLYHTINRVPKPKENHSKHRGGSTTFRGSSGRSHGGRGGRF